MKKFIILIIAIAAANFVQAQDSANQYKAVSKATGYEIQKHYEASIYPNPVTNNQFQVKSDNEIASVELINVIGQTVFRQKNEVLSNQLTVVFGECDEGLYLVKINFNTNKSIIKKIFVK